MGLVYKTSLSFVSCSCSSRTRQDLDEFSWDFGRKTGSVPKFKLMMWVLWTLQKYPTPLLVLTTDENTFSKSRPMFDCTFVRPHLRKRPSSFIIHCILNVGPVVSTRRAADVSRMRYKELVYWLNRNSFVVCSFSLSVLEFKKKTIQETVHLWV